MASKEIDKTLTLGLVEKIVKAYDGHKDVEGYARVASLKEIEKNDFNLNVRRYIENGDKEEDIDVSAVRSDLFRLEKEREEIDKRVQDYLSKLKY